MEAFVESLVRNRDLGPMVACRRRVEGVAARYGDPDPPLSPELRSALLDAGVERLYRHQAEALEAARAGRNVLAVTPTASGKTLVFALPVLETLLADRGGRALFLYPTKALAQDQLLGLRSLAVSASPLRPPRFEIYDGDTPSHRRRKIREEPPQVLLTNPDMLHMGILAHHDAWDGFLRNLRWVVLDELHVYRGVFGAHVHHILGRLRRLCGRRGASPRFIAASATVGNPERFSRTLVGEPFTVIRGSGAPRAPRHVLFVNPAGVSPYTVAVRLVAEAMRAGLRTIAFTKARRVTELMHTWLVQQVPRMRDRVAPYRAGYLPEERRRIEASLFRGDLLAVLSTSALELGIDVGGLDVCVLVGYPGSLISSWQRIGRVGRQDRDAVVVMVALPDALDQYVVSHPDLFFGDAFEQAVLDPWNRSVVSAHLVCAAAEEPLSREEVRAAGPETEQVVRQLQESGDLLLDASGDRWFARRRRPHRDVPVRSAGEPYSIFSTAGKLLGTVGGMRVFQECHPGAVYLHGGRSYRVLRLDIPTRRVTVEPARVDYYTVVLGEKDTEILERTGDRPCGPYRAGQGCLKVTVRIRGYQKKRLFTGETISEHPLEAPPLVFETTGFWIEMPPELPAVFGERGLHFMGGIHAVEHALIGLFPLLAIADRGDVGGISYTAHPQLGAPAVFLYDAVPGGAGLADQGFRDLDRLLRETLDRVSSCGCDDGCPGCIQSPRCGNGNRPLDRRAAILVLRLLCGQEQLDLEAAIREEEPEREPAAVAGGGPRKHGITRGAGRKSEPAAGAEVAGPAAMERVLVFDLETRRSAEEVGGWGNAHRMGLAVAVVYDLQRGVYRTYHEEDVERLLLDLAMADRVVGFNIDRFDLKVLSGYTEWDLERIRTLDLLARIHDRLGFRLSLGHLAKVNLGEGKSADGLQSLRWWKEGKLDLIERYCRKDVEVTRRLYELGREQGYLLYKDRAGREMRVPAGW